MNFLRLFSLAFLLLSAPVLAQETARGRQAQAAGTVRQDDAQAAGTKPAQDYVQAAGEDLPLYRARVADVYGNPVFYRKELSR